MTETDLVQVLRQIREDVQAGNRASARAVDEVLKLGADFRHHVIEESRARAKMVSDVELLKGQMGQVRGGLEDVEETTGQIEKARLDSERAKRAVIERRVGAVAKWGAGILAALIVAACGSVAGYAGRAFLLDVSKPAAAQGQR